MGKRKEVKFQHQMNGSSVARHRRSSSQVAPSSSDHERDSEPGSSTPNHFEVAPSKERIEFTGPSEFEKKKQTFITRTVWTVIMVGGFIASLLAGHLYIMILLTVIQVVSFKEVMGMINLPSRKRNLRFTKQLNWYFLGTTMYFLYGESVLYYFKHIVLVDKILYPFATHHRFISFSLYIFGFVFFVSSLKKGQYKFQFGQFVGIHTALFLLIVPVHFVMNNVLDGLIWFLFPAGLVIINDIMAYLCGMTFGRTPLIKLSPKKTVEGFIGAWICTIIFGAIFANYLSKSPYFTCPVTDLGATYFTGLECVTNPVFLEHSYPITLPPFIPAIIRRLFPTSLTFAPFQLHALFLSCCASFIAPFGGFFASGIKRTYDIKDFGDSIPGHGGITDRFDCQFIMGITTYFYYQTFIAIHPATVGGVIESALMGLTSEQQMDVVRGLTKHLFNQGAIPYSVVEYLANI